MAAAVPPPIARKHPLFTIPMRPLFFFLLFFFFKNIHPQKGPIHGDENPLSCGENLLFKKRREKMSHGCCGCDLFGYWVGGTAAPMAIVASAFISDRPNYVLLLNTAMTPRIDHKCPKKANKRYIIIFKRWCAFVFLLDFWTNGKKQLNLK
jgi:hypothetical protein